MHEAAFVVTPPVQTQAYLSRDYVGVDLGPLEDLPQLGHLCLEAVLLPRLAKSQECALAALTQLSSLRLTRCCTKTREGRTPEVSLDLHSVKPHNLKALPHLTKLQVVDSILWLAPGIVNLHKVDFPPGTASCLGHLCSSRLASEIYLCILPDRPAVQTCIALTILPLQSTSFFRAIACREPLRCPSTCCSRDCVHSSCWLCLAEYVSTPCAMLCEVQLEILELHIPPEHDCGDLLKTALPTCKRLHTLVLVGANPLDLATLSRAPQLGM